MNIDNLFKGKLKDCEVNAPDNIWNAIDKNLDLSINQTTGSSSNISPDVTTGTKGFLAGASGTTKIIAIVVGVATIGAGAYIYNRIENSNKSILSNNTKFEQVDNKTNNYIKSEELIVDNTDFVVNTNKITKDKQAVSPDDKTIYYNVSDIENDINLKISNPINNPEANSINNQNNYSNINIEKVKPSNNNSIQNNNISDTPSNITDFNIYIPNIITPNNDGHNDFFAIKNIEEFPDNSLIVFTRNNKIIFSAKNYKNTWDGGNTPKGTYFYKLELRKGGKTDIKTGSITLIR